MTHVLRTELTQKRVWRPFYITVSRVFIFLSTSTGCFIFCSLLVKLNLTSHADSKENRYRPAVLTPNLLTTTIVAPPSNAGKWQMGFNSAFKGLRTDC